MMSPDFSVARKRMIQEQLVDRGIRDPRVLEVMERIPRHEFVDPGFAAQAYEDRPLNIGLKQTISQPYMVGYMTEGLKLSGGEKILEIGTGSGYQTAVLCELVAQVHSIERLTPLSNAARKRLYRLGYMNFDLRIGDGTLGWPEAAPFDGILVTAATPSIPPPYLEQLKPKGRLILPVGSESQQELIRVTRMTKGFKEERLISCRFVKLCGEFGFSSAS
ncbi:MAG: protein-L-isoaspartate(D-aspartate) O-methyltransferase [Deltaproteobacteria bacterium]|nr:protein-L-isoaspartate(D-aspartate) O-methyltransferase [Deltaproteobacteria bacterium]